MTINILLSAVMGVGVGLSNLPSI